MFSKRKDFGLVKLVKVNADWLIGNVGQGN